MSTPAKFLKKPDTDLSDLDDDAIKKLGGGIVKRTIKLMLDASEEASDEWNEPALAFLVATAHIGLAKPVIGGAMVGLFHKDAGAPALEVVIGLAEQHRATNETVAEFLKLLRGELLSGDDERAAAFRSGAEALESSLS